MTKLTGAVANAYKSRIKTGQLPEAEVRRLVAEGKFDINELIDEGVVTERNYPNIVREISAKKEEEERRKREEEERIRKAEQLNTLINEIRNNRYNLKELKKMTLFHSEPLIREAASEHIKLLIRSQKISHTEIKDLVEIDRLFLEHQLVDEGILSREEANIIFARKIAVDETVFDPSRIPDPVEGRLDVFLFGVPGSGKTSLLSGLLYYAQKNASLEKKLDHTGGIGYMDVLIEAVMEKRVVGSTNAKAVQYMSFDVKDREQGLVYPFTIMEMSGEIFTYMYLENEEQIDLQDNSQTWRAGRAKLQKYFFQSQNPKSIMLVIDYKESVKSEKYAYEQSKRMEYLLTKLKDKDRKDGILQRVRSIILVVMKWDSEDTSGVRPFLQQNYRSVVELCQELADTHTHIEYVPCKFSLGRFHNEVAYDYKPADSKFLFDLLCQLAPAKQYATPLRRDDSGKGKDGGAFGLGKLFGRKK